MSSCEYEIDYNETLPQDKFVFSSFIEESDSIRMTIMHSAKPGIYVDFTRDDKDFDIWSVFAHNTEVSLWVNGIFKEKKIQRDCPSVVFDYLPQHNDEITLRVENKNYPSVEHKLVLDILPVRIDSFFAYTQTIGGENYIVVHLELTDDGDENYYRFNPILPVDRYYVTCPKILYESHPDTYMANSINIDFYENEDKYNHFGVFSNSNFKGQKYTIKLAYLRDRYYSYEGTQTSFEVSKIDAQAYNYLRTLGNTLDGYGQMMNPIIIQDAFQEAYGFISKKKTVRIPVSVQIF